MLLLPIAMAIDISEKIDKFLRHANLSFGEIARDYYFNFVISFGNTFMPLALFIAVILYVAAATVVLAAKVTPEELREQTVLAN